MHNKITYIKYNTMKHVMQYKINTFIQDSLYKTVQHQDISAPLKKSVKSAPHFLSNKRDYLF